MNATEVWWPHARQCGSVPGCTHEIIQNQPKSTEGGAVDAERIVWLDRVSLQNLLASETGLWPIGVRLCARLH